MAELAPATGAIVVYAGDRRNIELRAPVLCKCYISFVFSMCGVLVLRV